MRKKYINIFLFFAICSTMGALGYPSTTIADNNNTIFYVTNFSKSNLSRKLPLGWSAINFSSIWHHTDYKLLSYQGQIVIQAKAVKSASGIYRNLDIDLNKYRILNWSWMSTSRLPAANIRKKSTDDCLARIYVSFGTDPKNPVGVLNYVWANKSAKMSIFNSPYTKLSKVIVLENTTSPLHQWKNESRNIYNDYKRAFRKTPPLRISQISIMTDTDNTSSQTISYYGDIQLNSSKKP